MAQFAEPVVSFLLESISKLLIEEGKHLLGVTDKAQQLQSELRLMLSLVRSADQRQDEDATLREWISQSRDLSYEAENVLETLAFRVASRNVLKRSTCTFSECSIRHSVGLEIETLNNRVSNLTRRFHEFGIRGILEKEGPSSRQQQLIRRTYSHVEEDDFVGLEGDVKMLVEALVKEYKVVSICGMGGLGKTTIARKVYNHPDLKRHFDHFAWVCISQQWQTRDILVRILLKLIPEKKNDIQKCENVDMLVQELYQVQQNKKCLIVLDDIWSSSAWDCMRNAFPIRANSKILLTTRNKDVAIHIGPNGFLHEPRLLSKDESWELLQKKALGGRNFHGFKIYGDIRKFEELGKEMAEYCKGLPLAVVVLGGLLASKHDINEWEVVSKNVKFYLKKGETIGEEVGEVQKILALSYNDLPYQLKPCFLYLGMYPEDSEIETETLYQLWMAERMVSEADRIGEESMMDTAERYLWELAKRSMVQVRVKDEPEIRNIRSCRLHDLIRDLCLHKGEEENFLKVIDHRNRDHTESADSSTSSMGKIHRLVIFLDSGDVSNYHPPKKEMAKHVRSFKYSVESNLNSRGPQGKARFKDFKMLRALTIQNLFCHQMLITSFDNQFGLRKLVHLRYLCLRGSINVDLPSSMGRLQHLETLDLRECDIVSCTLNFVHRLRNLRHLYLFDDDDNNLWSCCKLHLGGMTKLEVLENFSSKVCRVKDLYKLTNLQVLRANIHEGDGAEVMNCILNLAQLKQVKLRIYNFDSSHGFEQLFRSNLRHLSLQFNDGNLNKLPEYRTDCLKYLIELQLQRTFLGIDPMETLEKLPKLQRLWMGHRSFNGKEMTCHAMGFSQLTFLAFHNLYELENWIVEEGAMACLSHLHISSCHKLKMVPGGLRFITTLTELAIVDMPPKFSDRVRVIDGREGEDFDKVRHVASVALR